MRTRVILIISTVAIILLAVPLLAGLLLIPVSRGDAQQPGAVVDTPATVERVRQSLARDLGLARDDLEVVEYERRDWPNGCLGLPGLDEFCTETIVPGYRVVFRTPASDHHLVRTNTDGSHYRLEDAGDHRGAAPEEIADLVRFALRQRLHDESVEVVSVEEHDWPNRCLGLPYPGACTEAIVPGYRVVLQSAGGEYVARTNLEGSFYRLESSAVRIPHSPDFAWRSITDAGCLEIALFAGGAGVVLGCGEAPTPFTITERQSLEFLERTLRYQAIDRQDDDAWLVIRGSGHHEAGEHELRAVGEWATLEAQAAFVGRRGASWGLAIAWQLDTPEGCLNAHLQRYGVASLSRCKPEANLGDLVLDAGQLATLYGWLDRYAPFEEYDKESESFFLFSGSGSEEAGEATGAEIRAWLEVLQPNWQDWIAGSE